MERGSERLFEERGRVFRREYSGRTFFRAAYNIRYNPGGIIPVAHFISIVYCAYSNSQAGDLIYQPAALAAEPASGTISAIILICHGNCRDQAQAEQGPHLEGQKRVSTIFQEPQGITITNMILTDAAKNIALTFLILCLIPGALAAQGGTRPQEMIYYAFTRDRMETWVRAINILEKEYRQTGNIDVLYELTLARYGYIGYSLGIGDRSSAREQIGLAEEDIDKLTASTRHESSAYALQAALYAYRISMAPWRAVFWGQRSMNLIDKAIETDHGNPQAWLEHGNAMFYAPATFGGSKEKALESYNRAIRLFEADMKEHHRWLYLNTLVALAKSYQETGNKAMARITYRKALEFEPEFTWVRETLLPALEGQ
ncbi:MAG: tetratricopeptide repeat protein [Marinilabiliales bacterium]|nr:MAG: tetratricopeptide repeat protein [Marinilabiliales bacterium]